MIGLGETSLAGFAVTSFPSMNALGKSYRFKVYAVTDKNEAESGVS